MRRMRKTILGIFLVFLVGALVIVFASRKVKSLIDSEFGDELKYEDLKVNLLRNRLVFTEPKLKAEGLQLEASQILVSGFNVWQYLTEESIVINDVLFSDPDVTYFPEEVDSTSSEKPEMELLIKSIATDQGSFRIKEADSVVLYLSLDHIGVNGLGVDAESLKAGFPFSFSSYEVAGDSLFSALDERHHFTLGNLQVRDGEARAKDLRVVPKYGKMEFQQHIPHEMDRFELIIEEIHLEGMDWGLENDSLFMKTALLEITGADLEVYRDKLQPKDTTIKPLYSAQIRNAPINFAIEKVEVKESSIVYEERLDQERPAAKVFFTSLYSSIYNLGNMGIEPSDVPQTKIEARANLMGEPQVKVDWTFDSSNLQDDFRISGEFGALSAEGINSFLRPAMSVEAQGGISSLAFDYSGNDDAATGSMKIRYEDFRINVLKDDGTEKNNFLSAIANLFVSEDAVDEDVHNQDLRVERDKTKSFWNYLWLCIREGAISSLL